MPDIKVNKCILCKEEFYGFGHNPQPLGEGRCCSACNDNLVIPVRIERAFGISSSVKEARRPSIKEDNAHELYCYAYFNKNRWPEAEPTIMKDPEQAHYYARDVIKGRWTEAEPTILKNPEWANWYATDVIKGRWPEAEPIIMKDQIWAFVYARNVLSKSLQEITSLLKDLPDLNIT